VEGLGSKEIERKVGAAITLRTFLHPDYESFHRQTFDLAVAHLRLRKAEPEESAQTGSAAPSQASTVLAQQPSSPKQTPDDRIPPIPLNSLSQADSCNFLVRPTENWQPLTFDGEVSDAGAEIQPGHT
jgi:hypothetical protein